MKVQFSCLGLKAFGKLIQLIFKNQFKPVVVLISHSSELMKLIILSVKTLFLCKS